MAYDGNVNKQILNETCDVCGDQFEYVEGQNIELPDYGKGRGQTDITRVVCDDCTCRYARYDKANDRYYINLKAAKRYYKKDQTDREEGFCVL